MIKTDNWTHYVRMKEISQILPYLDKEFKILEIGSGDGYIAKYLNDIGYNVVATDLNPRIPSYYNIQKVSANPLPFSSNSFDIVLSSNVLEHIKDLEDTLKELSRVLKMNGLMIHSVPTQTCSFFTTLFYPIFYFKKMINIFKNDNFNLTSLKTTHSIFKILNKFISFLIFVNPINIVRWHGHGISLNPVHEFFLWSKYKWGKIFKKNDLNIVIVIHHSLFYTMLKLLPFKLIKLRIFLGKMLYGSHVFVLQKNPTNQIGQ